MLPYALTKRVKRIRHISDRADPTHLSKFRCYVSIREKICSTAVLFVNRTVKTKLSKIASSQVIRLFRNLRTLTVTERATHLNLRNSGSCERTVFFAKYLMADIDKEELRKRLTPIQYHVTQEKGTERPFSGCYNKTHESGTYTCVVCNEELFSSKTKFESGCGWPAFSDVIEQGKIKLTKDTSHGMVRTEVTCANCGAHLGHVFNDGPKPSRKRYCINSAAMNFHPDLQSEEKS